MLDGLDRAPGEYREAVGLLAVSPRTIAKRFTVESLSLPTRLSAAISGLGSHSRPSKAALAEPEPGAEDRAVGCPGRHGGGVGLGRRVLTGKGSERLARDQVGVCPATAARR